MATSSFSLNTGLHVVQRRRHQGNTCIHIDTSEKAGAPDPVSENTHRYDEEDDATKVKPKVIGHAGESKRTSEPQRGGHDSSRAADVADVLISRHSRGFDLQQYNRYKCFDSIAFHPNLSATYDACCGPAANDVGSLKANGVVFIHGGSDDCARLEVFHNACREAAKDLLLSARAMAETSVANAVSVSFVDMCHLWGVADVLDRQSKVHAVGGLRSLRQHKSSFINNPRSKEFLKPVQVQLQPDPRRSSLHSDESAQNMSTETMFDPDAWTIDDILRRGLNLEALKQDEADRVDHDETATMVVTFHFHPSSGTHAQHLRESLLHIVLLPPVDRCNGKNKTGTEVTAVENCLRLLVQHEQSVRRASSSKPQSRSGSAVRRPESHNVSTTSMNRQTPPAPHLPLRESPALLYMQSEITAPHNHRNRSRSASPADLSTNQRRQGSSRRTSPMRHTSHTSSSMFVGGDGVKRPTPLTVGVIACVCASAFAYTHTHSACECIRRIRGGSGWRYGRGLLGKVQLSDSAYLRKLYAEAANNNRSTVASNTSHNMLDSSNPIAVDHLHARRYVDESGQPYIHIGNTTDGQEDDGLDTHDFYHPVYDDLEAGAHHHYDAQNNDAYSHPDQYQGSHHLSGLRQSQDSQVSERQRSFQGSDRYMIGGGSQRKGSRSGSRSQPQVARNIYYDASSMNDVDLDESNYAQQHGTASLHSSWQSNRQMTDSASTYQHASHLQSHPLDESDGSSSPTQLAETQRGAPPPTLSAQQIVNNKQPQLPMTATVMTNTSAQNTSVASSNAYPKATSGVAVATMTSILSEPAPVVPTTATELAHHQRPHASTNTISATTGGALTANDSLVEVSRASSGDDDDHHHHVPAPRASQYISPDQSAERKRSPSQKVGKPQITSPLLRHYNKQPTTHPADNDVPEPGRSAAPESKDATHQSATEEGGREINGEHADEKVVDEEHLSSLHTTNEAVLSLKIQLEQHQRSTQLLTDQLRRVTSERDALRDEVRRVEAENAELRRQSADDLPLILEEVGRTKKELQHAVAGRAELQLENQKLKKENKKLSTESTEFKQESVEIRTKKSQVDEELARVTSQLASLHDKYCHVEQLKDELQTNQYEIDANAADMRQQLAKAKSTAEESVFKMEEAVHTADRIKAEEKAREDRIDELEIANGKLEFYKREMEVRRQNLEHEVTSLRSRNDLLERKVATVAHISADVDAITQLRAAVERLEKSLKNERRLRTDIEMENTRLRLKIDDLVVQLQGELKPQMEALMAEEQRWHFGSPEATREKNADGEHHTSSSEDDVYGDDDEFIDDYDDDDFLGSDDDQNEIAGGCGSSNSAKVRRDSERLLDEIEQELDVRERRSSSLT